jgi:carbamoyltransferase
MGASEPRGTEWVLAIHEDSNANATIFHNGEPIFAVAEERLTRNKFQAGFPTQSVAACLKFAGIGLDDLDAVVPANQTHFLPRLAPGLIPEGDHNYFGVKHKAWTYFQTALARQGLLGKMSQWMGRGPLKKKVPRLTPFVDHHTAHAYSAYLTSGFKEAVAITADNMGDGYSAKVFDSCEGRCDFLYGSPAHQSPGQFYGEIAQFLGFHNLMAGKVTGMAAHGDPRRAYPIMERLFQLHDSKERFVLPELIRRGRKRGPFKELSDHDPFDVAAAAQRRLEDVMLAFVQHALERTGRRSVVLAGGTFANVVLNQRILALDQVDEVFVHPAMTDQGISMGAGLCWLAGQGVAQNRPLPSMYLGPENPEDALILALSDAGLEYSRPEDMAKEVADLLVEKKVIARCAGPMEYGLRALGNRSILYRPDDPAVNVWLNEKLRRSEYMPFAPMVLRDYAEKCFEGTEGGALAARAMTITFEATPWFAEIAPGVVHLDGTARPQFLSEDDNAPMAAILQAFHEKTGIPAVVNTSFNMHHEPIVCTGEDAISAYEQSELDALILGPFLVVRG